MSVTTDTLLNGRYRLKHVLGAGGMGTVYEAEDLRLTRRVAVKVVKSPDDEETTAGERLFREAKAAAQADHPAIITVFGFGTDDSKAVSYLVMERLDGEDLAARITRVGPLSARLVARIGAEVADGLAAAHDAGVVHRDLKPGNIFLAKRGLRVDEVKILDFGVAKHLDLHTLTATGQMFGTLYYMAPEQITDSKRVDARADVYALGVMLFECLTGVRPFDAPNAVELASAILLGTRPSLRSLAPNAPPELCRIIEGCLARAPRDRIASARDVCSNLLQLAGYESQPELT